GVDDGEVRDTDVGADLRAVAHPRAAADDRAGADVGVLADPRAGGDDRAAVEPRAVVELHLGAHGGTRVDVGTGGDPGGRVDAGAALDETAPVGVPHVPQGRAVVRLELHVLPSPHGSPPLGQGSG